jgi:tetratricopeptide (TPR) repeat protein
VLLAGSFSKARNLHRSTDKEVRTLLEESTKHQHAWRIPEALESARKSRTALASGAGSAELKQLVEKRIADLEFAVQLEEVRSGVYADLDTQKVDFAAMNAKFSELFSKALDADIDALTPQEAAERIRSRSVAVEMAAALDNWAIHGMFERRADAAGQAHLVAQTIGAQVLALTGGPMAGTAASVVDLDATKSDAFVFAFTVSWRHRLAIARLADADSVRNRIRSAFESKEIDLNAIRDLAASIKVADTPEPTILLLAEILFAENQDRSALDLLQRAYQHRQNSFWINHHLAISYQLARPTNWASHSARYLAAALAIRPTTAAVWIHLSRADYELGNLEDAEFMLRRAIHLKPDLAIAHFNLGVIQQERGNLDEAIRCYKDTHRFKSNDHEAFYALGTAFALQRKWPEAIASTREALKLKSDFFPGYTNLASILIQSGDYQTAIAECHKAIRVQKLEFAPIYFQLGKAHKHLKHWSEAASAYRQSIKLWDDSYASKFRSDRIPTGNQRVRYDFPGLHSIWFELGSVLREDQKLTEAAEAYHQAIQLNPDFHEAYLDLGAIYLQQNELAGAEKAFRAAIDAKKDYGEAYVNLAHALREQNRLTESEQVIQKCIWLNPDFAGAYFHLGGLLMGKRDWAKAETAFATVIKKKPDFIEAYVALADALRRQNKLSEAVEAYRKYFELEKITPPQPDVTLIARSEGFSAVSFKALAHFDLGETLCAMSQFDAGIAEFRAAIQVEPNFVEAYFELGKELRQKGMYTDAIDAFQQAVQVKPSYAEAHFEVGMLYLDQKDLAAAEKAFRRAIEVKQSYAEAHVNLGFVLRRLNRLPESENAMQRGVQLRPNWAEAHFHLGTVCQDQGNWPMLK